MFVSIFFVYKKRECVAHLRNVQRRRQTIMNLWVRVKEIDRRYERLMRLKFIMYEVHSQKILKNIHSLYT